MSPTLETPPAAPSLQESVTTSRISRFRRGSKNLADSLFGFFAMIGALAVVSVIPVLNLLSLGYMLEASARVARSGRWRDGFIGMQSFSRLGKIVFGIWIWILPLRLIYSFWIDAELIDPGGARGKELQGFFAVSTSLVGLHLVWALIQGGKLRHFFWPAPISFIRWLGTPHPVRPLWNSFVDRIKSLTILKYFRTGFFGFLVAAAWLALPVLVLFFGASVKLDGPAFLVSLLGGILLGTVALFLPFLQTRLAMTNSLREGFSIRSIRTLFRRAPIAFWLALVITLLFSLPLYLLKIELTPREVAWLPNLLFVFFLFPARILTGWAIYRGEKRETSRIWVSRWLARLAALPVVAIYVLVVWLAQYLSWHGSLSLIEQHAFLVPAPLLGL